MAPEQMAGEPLDRRADLYGVGAILWEALAGERMWSGLPDVAVINNVLNTKIPSPRSVNPNVNPRLEQICMKALSFAREDRYASAQEFELDLDRALEELEIAVKPRDVGTFVSELFAETRREFSAHVEQVMARVSALTPEEYQAAAGGTFLRTPHVDERSQPTGTSATTLVRAKGKTRIVWGLVASLCGVAIASWVLVHRAQTQRTHAAMVAASASALAPASATPDRVYIELNIVAVPKQARLYLDGELLPWNPYTLTFVQDGSKHTIRVEAPGYIPQTQEITLDKNAGIPFALEREPDPPGKPPRSRHAVPSASSQR